jgi:hypothetical protein
MSSHEVLEKLSEYGNKKVRILLLEENIRGGRGSNIITLGYLKKYAIVQPQNTISLFFVETNTLSPFDLLHSIHVINDVRFNLFDTDNITIDSECRDRISTAKTGVLEQLKLTEPISKKIDKVFANSFSINYNLDAIQNYETSAASLAIIQEAWKRIEEAKPSNDSLSASAGLCTIADTLDQESLTTSLKNPRMAEALTSLSYAIRNKATQIEKKLLTVEKAESIILQLWFLEKQNN